jgi:ElaB/YqjD/DUF883 family membrane-anchored ribosome-binding protein
MAKEQDQKQGNQGRQGAAQQVADKDESATQSVKELAQNAMDKYDEYSQQASETYEHSREHVNQWLVDLREQAVQEPVKTLLKAAGVGVILGVLFG